MEGTEDRKEIAKILVVFWKVRLKKASSHPLKEEKTKQDKGGPE